MLDDLFRGLGESETPRPVSELVALFRQWAPLHAQLCRTLDNGNPIGAFGETLVAAALGGKLLTNSTAGHDVVLADGRRVEVKSRLWKGQRSDNEFGAASCPPDTTDWPFDLAAFVQLDLATMMPRVAFMLPAAALPQPRYNGSGPRKVWGTKVFANRIYAGAVNLRPRVVALLAGGNGSS
jgi:hypothetical protein